MQRLRKVVFHRVRFATIVAGLGMFVCAGTASLGASVRPRTPLPKPATISKPAFDSILVVKFLDDLKVRESTGRLVSTGQEDLSNVDAVAARYTLSFEPLIKLPQQTLDSLQARAEALSGVAQPDLAGMMIVHGPEVNLEQAARELLALAEVEWVNFSMVKPDPPCIDIEPDTPDYFGDGRQDYHDPDPGLDMAHAWDNGAWGQGVKIADCEYAYELDHEDLCNIANWKDFDEGAVHVKTQFDNHGTAVLGMMVAPDNGYGCTGLVPEAAASFFTEWPTTGWQGARPTAIAAATDDLEACDVLVLEMQTKIANHDYGPAETDSDVYDETKLATDARIIVVAAAGNGNEDLNGGDYATWRLWGDSGAIIVGAGTADLNHDKMDFSSYGPRVDVQGWGKDVVFTLGYGDFAQFLGPGFVGDHWCHDGTSFIGKCSHDINTLCYVDSHCGVGNICHLTSCDPANGNADCEFGQTCRADDRRQSYTDSFSGTSSATPMVASAAAAIQSYAAKELGCKFGPRGMRKLLIDTGIAQGAGGNIGPFPDLKAAIDKVDTLTDCNYGSFNDACDGIVTGACCLLEDSAQPCVETTEDDCIARGGAYQGNGTSCTPGLCAPLTGACCDSSGECTEVNQAACNAGGGSYRGDGTTCTPNPCQPPTGACCDPAGGCTVVDEAACLSAGGAYKGNGTRCLGDADGNGIDDACEVFPTVSEWGLVVLTLLLLTGMAIKFGRRRSARA